MSYSKCTKVKFSSEKYAKDHIPRILEKKKKRNKDVPTEIGTYFCKLCKSWHITAVYSATSEAFNSKVQKLETEVKELKLDLQHSVDQDWTAERRKIRKDEYVQQILEHNRVLRKRNKDLENQYDTLLSKYFALKKLVEDAGHFPLQE
jgi:Mg2+ and Co2+ transporter CorA